jgi:N-acetylglucosaminyldiphosphoundecaprenol N-acetyl-beta-D-mannosaminyltransferase
MTVSPSLLSQNVIGFPVTAVPFETQVAQVIQWAKGGLSKVVCVANVHMLVEAREDASLANILNRADMVTPDGMPLVWMLKMLRKSEQDRVAGMDLMMSVCQAASQQGLSVYFLGSETPVLERLRLRLQQDFPNLKIAGMESLPMLSVPIVVDQTVVEMVNRSGASIVFLALGCPKQEKWMAAYHNRINAVMLGVGGVFPVYAGLQQRAPEFIRSAGLEWLYRLVQEPRRLWKRYSKTIPPFVWLAGKQLMRSARSARTILPTQPELELSTQELVTSGQPGLRR